MKVKKEDFFRVLLELQQEPWFRRALRLRGGTPLIALYLRDYSSRFSKDSYFEISISKIAKNFNFDRTAVSKMISRLEEAGLISRDLNGANNRIAVKIVQVTDDNLPGRFVENKPTQKLRSLKIGTDRTENENAMLPMGIGAIHERK